MRFFDYLSLIWSSAVMVLVFWMVGFFAWLFLVTVFDVSESWISFSLFLLLAVLGLVGGVYSGYVETKAQAHCESCSFDWVVNKNGEEHISESTKTEVVRKYGEGEKNTRREVTTEIYWQHYKCTKCNARTQVKCSRSSSSAEY